MAVIREAAIEDVPGIARVHIESWRTTYKGMVPQHIIDGFTYEQREALWRRALDPGNASFVYVAEEDGEVVGFASGGPAREDVPNHAAELYAIYLLQEHQGKGIGRRLFDAVVRELVRRGLYSMAIWVLAENPACGFYEAMGGRKVYERQEEADGVLIDEVGYGWDDITALAGNGVREA
ncbi:MAG: GNAT family N-acetyltransferase [Chloroflexota bacterium]|nr:GNAT family N-acetyltransferase [Chloroflexota bacterium]MDQ5865803.1 GNAT family N-acetyltransferase [Chloroflexota bacterium]